MTEPTLAEWLLEAIAEDEALIGPAASDAFHGQPGALFQWGHEVDVNFPRLAAECAAKRAIVAEHAVEIERVTLAQFDALTGRPNAPEWDVTCRMCGWCDSNLLGGCATVKLLAAPYADRPGFREEWRP